MGRRPTIVGPSEAASGVTKEIRSAAPRRSFASRLFGYDIFLSFALGPPPRGTLSYASDLARRLQERDYTVFFSEQEMPPGERLDSALETALFRSKALVVIANRGTLQEPRWVRKEVEAYRQRHPDRPVIPINVGGVLEDPVLADTAQEWLKYQGRIWIDESEEGVASGIASEAVVDRLATAPRRSRANVRWRWVTRGTVTLLTLLTIGLGVAAKIANDNEKKANKQTALAQQREREAKDAAEREKQAKEEEKRQRDIAVINEKVAVEQRNIAEERRKEAERQRYLTISQALAAYAPRELEQGRMDERAALLVRHAFIFHQRYRGTHLDQVDRSLRQVLSTPYFSVRLSSGEDKATLNCLALSKDDGWLAVGGDDSKVRIWSLKKLKSAPLILGQKYGIIRSLTFGLKSDELFAGTEDGTIVSWKLDQTGAVKDFRAFPGRGEGRILSVSISPEGDRLASGSEDGKVRIWNLREPSADPVILTLSRERKAVWAVSFHPTNNDILVSGGENKQILIWDLKRANAPVKILEGPDSTVKSVAFSPEGKWLVCGTDRKLAVPSFGDMRKAFDEGQEVPNLSIVGGTILLWSLEKPDEGAKKVGSHQAAVTSLAFNKAGNILASGSDDKTMRLWQLRQSAGPPVILRGHESSVVGVRFYQGDQILASAGGGDSSVRLWDMRRPDGDPKVLKGHQGAVLSLAFSPDSKWVASVDGEEESVRLWSIDQEEAKIFLRYPKGKPVSVSFHPREEVVASGSDGGILHPENTVSLWDLANPEKPKNVLPHRYKSSVNVLAFSENGRLLASAGRFDQEIVVWDMSRPETARAILTPKPPANISSLAFGSGGQKLAAACDDKTVRIWDMRQQTRDPVILKGHKAPVNSVTLSPDGTTLFSGDEDGTLYRWNLKEPEKKPVILWKYGAKIHSLGINRAGASLVVGNSDGKVRVLDLISASSDSRVLRGPGADVYTVAFSPNGNWFATGGSDTTLVVWPSTEALVERICEKVRRNLYETEWQQLIGPDIPYEVTCPNLPSPKGP